MSTHAIPAGLRKLVASRFPGAEIISAKRLGGDETSDATAKAAGYGEPIQISLQTPAGERHELVLHFAGSDWFGHDRRSDRAAEQLLAFDTFGLVERQVRAVDVGALVPPGELVSLAQSGELYLLTEYAEGVPYAEDLRRIERGAQISPLDRERVSVLARYLARLHVRLEPSRDAYRRAVRDLLGHGEGIFGIVDGYPDATPGAGADRLAAIEHACLEWRHRLRDRAHRLSRTHGDFHPFNILFAEGAELRLLDASRGCQGDPADDVAALAINYVFFAVSSAGAWRRGLGELWRSFWGEYLQASGDRELLEVVAPFLAWRGLVVCNPRWYPALPAEQRDRLLGLVERALGAQRFEPEWAEDLFR
jgi:aminoglycoside phosphotransferase (APT) family kinase protein